MATWRERSTQLGLGAVGGLLGGCAGAAAAVIVTEAIKRTLAALAGQSNWLLLVAPLVGLALAVVILNGYHRGEALQVLLPEPVLRRRLLRGWTPSRRDIIRADLTADVVATAGEEERFPWRLAPVRALAIVSTVGLGAPMGTESPAAHIGVATGAFLGERWRSLVRPAAVGGGGAGVAALIGNPLVGTAFILELGRRRQAPLSAERVVAAVFGGLAGWGINRALGLNLITLNVPDVAPNDLFQALVAALLVGAIAGTITSLTGTAIYAARGWQARPGRRLLLGGVGVAVAAIAIAAITAPAAAFGPGAGAAAWADTHHDASLTLLGLVLLRAVATTAAVAAGGCGGVFVPFLAMGDIAGRVFAPTFGVPSDLAGAAGAAGGIAGGYRLPVTAAAMVLGLGGPYTATLTCLATVGVATVAGVGAGLTLDRVTDRLSRPQAAA